MASSASSVPTLPGRGAGRPQACSRTFPAPGSSTGHVPTAQGPSGDGGPWPCTHHSPHTCCRLPSGVTCSLLPSSTGAPAPDGSGGQAGRPAAHGGQAPWEPTAGMLGRALALRVRRASREGRHPVQGRGSASLVCQPFGRTVLLSGWRQPREPHPCPGAARLPGTGGRGTSVVLTHGGPSPAARLRQGSRSPVGSVNGSVGGLKPAEHPQPCGKERARPPGERPPPPNPPRMRAWGGGGAGHLETARAGVCELLSRKDGRAARAVLSAPAHTALFGVSVHGWCQWAGCPHSLPLWEEQREANSLEQQLPRGPPARERGRVDRSPLGVSCAPRALPEWETRCLVAGGQLGLPLRWRGQRGQPVRRGHPR